MLLHCSCVHRDEASIARWLEPFVSRSGEIAEVFVESIHEVRVDWRDGRPREVRVRREEETSARWRSGTREQLVLVPGGDEAAAREAIRGLRSETGSETRARRPRGAQPEPPEAIASAEIDRWSKRLGSLFARHAPRHRFSWRMLDVRRRIVAAGQPAAGSSRRLVSLEGRFLAASRLTDEERAFSFHSPESDSTADELRTALTAAAAPRDRPTAVPAGTADVLLAHGSAAVLFHEIVGHALEADAELSPFAPLKDARVAVPELEVSDDARRLDLFGGYERDDEGTSPKPVRLIHAGGVGSRLTDRAHAGARGSTGHGRRSGPGESPHPRGSNVVVRAGSATPDEMVRRLANGIWIDWFQAGSVELANGTFRLEFPRARRIRRGRLADELGAGILAGEILPTLRSIEPVLGREVRVCRSLGWCARAGQVVPVQGEAPDVLIRGLMLRPAT
jgi:predicted Zn-dependent protease